MTAIIDALTDINLRDLAASFGVQDRPALASILRIVFRGPARRFAQYMLDLDRDVGEYGLPEGSRRFARKHLAQDVRVFGREFVPPSGPVLVLSNHPGMSDTVALFAAIDRADLKVLALQNPILASLVNVSRRLYYLSNDGAESVRMVRHASAHLREGKALLTFPAGRIEPDPEVHEGAADALGRWSESAGIFMRVAPDTAIIPALVSGVIWERTAHHWLTGMRRDREERDKFAAALQLLVMLTRHVRPTVIKVRFAEAITLAEIGSLKADVIHHAVMARMRELLQAPVAGEGVSAL